MSESSPPYGGRKSRSPGRRKVLEAAAVYEAMTPRAVVDKLVEVLGNERVAQIVGVSASQPSRWRSGKDRISTQNLRVLIDLDYIVNRLSFLWPPSVIPSWFEGNNPHANGRPLDVAILRGPMALLAAVDADEAGSYA